MDTKRHIDTRTWAHFSHNPINGKNRVTDSHRQNKTDLVTTVGSELTKYLRQPAPEGHMG